MTEVEFCVPPLREGRRSPAPEKLLPIQRMGYSPHGDGPNRFLGAHQSFFAEYVPGYAEKAGPLMEKLKLNRHDGKKGSTLALRCQRRGPVPHRQPAPIPVNPRVK